MTIDERIEKAYGYVQNDTNYALELFNEILEEEPYNINAINGKGSALMKLHKNEDALKVFDFSLSIEENSSAYLNKGIIAKGNEDYRNALKYFDKALDYNQRLNSIVSLLKNEILETVDFETSDIGLLYDFEDEANSLIKESFAYRKQNQLWDALDCLEEAIEKDPKCKNSANDLIKKLTLTIKKEFGYREINSKSTKINKLKFLTIKSIIVEDNPHKALLLTDKIFEIDKDDTDALNYRGIIYFSMNEYEKAIESFDKCLSIDPDYTCAIFNKGLVFRRMKLFDKSLKCFNTVLNYSNFLKKVKPYQEEVLTKIN
ncbi:MAG: tetratricopeptide repeat protein [Methanobrevibacter sp.]|nr:tetratricopeptide repeat protein [Methanobrevibacter sp.]